MKHLIKGLFLFCCALLLLGGAVIPTAIGKIEIGSIDPFGFLLLLCLLMAYLFKKSDLYEFLKWQKQFWKLDTADTKKWAILIFSVLAFILFCSHSARHLNLKTHQYDSAFVHSGLFFPFLNGKILWSSLSPLNSYLVDHFAPSLLLLTPLTALFKSKLVIFALQALLLTGGAAVLLFYGPAKKLRELFFALAFILICHRAFRNAGLWDFREDVLAFFLLSCALVLLWNRKILAYFALFIVACFTKEHIGLVCTGIVLPILLDKNLPYTKKERIRLGIVSFFIAAGHAALVLGYIAPQLQSSFPHVNNITKSYAQFGATPSEIIINTLTTPTLWYLLLKKYFTWPAIKYVALLAAPYLFFARKSWYWLAAPAIAILANMGTPSFTQRSQQFHYDAVVIPFFMMGLLSGLYQWNKSNKLTKTHIVLGVLLALTFSGRWPLFQFNQNIFYAQADLNNWKISYELNKVQCPTDAPIAAPEWLIAQITHCPSIRALELPEHCPAPTFTTRTEWKSFITPYSPTLAMIPGKNALEANTLILDTRKECQRLTATRLIALGNQATLVAGGAQIITITPNWK